MYRIKICPAEFNIFLKNMYNHDKDCLCLTAYGRIAFPELY